MRHIFQTIVQAGRAFGQGLLHLVYPRICWVCQQIQPMDEKAVCGTCAAQLVSDTRPTCFRCASTVGPYVDTTQGCHLCRGTRFAFDQTFRLGPYEGLLREVVLRMKNFHGEGLAEAFAEFWARQVAPRLAPLAADLIVPVPLHWKRQYSRGFNQSAVLAQALAAELRLPCATGRLQRGQATEDQKDLQGQLRWDNVKGAFRLQAGADLGGKTIVLVDDVLTTGATAHEAARPLRAMKPKRIVVAVVAHDR